MDELIPGQTFMRLTEDAQQKVQERVTTGIFMGFNRRSGLMQIRKSGQSSISEYIVGMWEPSDEPAPAEPVASRPIQIGDYVTIRHKTWYGYGVIFRVVSASNRGGFALMPIGGMDAGRTISSYEEDELVLLPELP